MKYLFILFCFLPFPEMKAQGKFYPKLSDYCSEAARHFDEISGDRRILLDDLAGYVYAHLAAENKLSLTFICTHNSRRSHMAQLWASAAAAYYGIGNVYCFSGGTEATAFHKNAIATLKRAGFRIVMTQPGKNPLYEASWHSSILPVRMFSKKYDDGVNPNKDFGAVMVCSEADKNCPFVPGAATRMALPYEDPKVYDETPGEAAMYDERCRQIAIEMLYVMLQVKEKIVMGG